MMIRLLMNVYLFISDVFVLDCIICFDNQSNDLNLILLRHNIGRYRVTTNSLYYFISLYYFEYFCSVWVCELKLSWFFSLDHTI